ncbi:MAG: hypothetical protein IJN09_01740 [Oscillospiraceae bacterium]|nr:hypothetical protein [Oscillospiraceae bacterium]
MFEESNNTQEQELALPEKLFDDDETEINDTAEIAEEEKSEAVSETQNETEEEPASPEADAEEIENARSRALAQVERLSRDTGFSGPWGSLFRAYPALSRNDAFEQLGDAVNGGMTPLEAYQQKLLEEKERELEMIRSTSTARKRSIGAVVEENTESELDDFLAGFYSV